MPAWKKLLIVIALVPVFTVAFLETVPRWIDIPGLRENDLDPFRDPARRARIQPHPYLAYSPKPNLRFEGKKHTIEHNSLGFRGPEISWDKPEGTFRIACLGGSSTYGHGPSSNETTWPMRLEHYLREQYPGRAIEVINGGCQGYSSFESVQNLAHRVLPLEPDVVIVYHTINDMRCALYPGVERDNSHWRAVWMQRQPMPLEASYTYLVWRRYFTDALRLQGDMASFLIVDFNGKVDPYAWRPGETELGIENFHRNLNTIITLSEANGARVLLGTQAMRFSDTQRVNAGSFADQQRAFESMSEVVELVARERGVSLADARTPLESEAERQLSEGAETDDLFTSEVHVTDRGADMIAQVFAAAIIDEGWIQ